MNQFHISKTPFAAILAGAFSLTSLALAADPVESVDSIESREKPLVLLESVKRRELESQLTLKQTEIQRLNEDLDKHEKEQASLQQSMDAIAIAIAESNDLLDQYLARRKHLTRALELTTQRIDAERLKVDGLKTLSDAQMKERDHVARQVEATKIRSNIEGANLRILSYKQTPPPEGEAVPKDATAKLLSEIVDLKKKLDLSERKTFAAGKLAREAMSSASAKLVQAENAGVKAKKTAEDWNLNEHAEPVAEKVDPDPASLAPQGDSAVEKKL
ncbi:MAG: hypothetical protein ABIZ56_08505 [Chthoniobacteraceae bacterium]